jgi:hypothetical protein
MSATKRRTSVAKTATLGVWAPLPEQVLLENQPVLPGFTSIPVFPDFHLEISSQNDQQRPVNNQGGMIVPVNPSVIAEAR